MATAAMSAANTAAIMLNIFDGSRQLIGAGVKNLLVRIIDGNQKELLSKFLNGATCQFQVPFYDNLGDFYTVVASADNYKQAGFTPIHVGPTVPQTVDLMLLPSDGSFRFGDAGWTEIEQTHPEIHAVLANGATEADAQARYENLMENNKPALACLWNLMTAMRDIDLPTGTPLTYLKQLVWEDAPLRVR